MNDFNGAVNAVKEIPRSIYKDAESLFREFPPKEKKCDNCDHPIVFFLDGYSWEWKPAGCSNCQKIKIKNEIKSEINETMRAKGIPKRFLGAEISQFPKKYKELVSGDYSKGYFLHGPRGTGKTHLMSAIMKDMILNAELSVGYESCSNEERTKIPYYFKPDEYPLFITVPNLLLKIRSCFGDDSVSEEDLIDEYCKVSVLFLDDLGTEKVSDWVLQTLYLIIDYRYGEMKKTIISSNYNLDQIANRLDDRIASRIAGMCKVFEISGADRRIVG
ncbi:MAG: AAA family ATPase [Candidatus Levybacteria bacterium]|nr:AAA family ATPase [Candidatus Levybacteria bacterium]